MALPPDMVCRQCRRPLNQFRHPDGTVEHVHGRAWENYDHDPDPVASTRIGGRIDRVCDFCGEPDPAWSFESADIVESHGGGRHGQHMGTHWAACAVCDRLIRHRDLDALSTRSLSSAASNAERHHLEETLGVISEVEWERRNAMIRQMHAAFLGSVKGRQPMPPPPPPPTRLDPRRLPKVRDRLIDYWSSDFAFTVMTSATPPDDPIAVPGSDVDDGRFAVRARRLSGTAARSFMVRTQTALAVGDLYWISKEFVVLAINAGRKLPDFTITVDDLPSKAGLMVFEEPIYEVATTSDGDTMALVVAASWAPVRGGVWLTCYIQPEQVYPYIDRDQLRHTMGFLLPISPGSGFPFETTVTDFDVAAAGDNSKGLWPTVLSTWFLLAQPGVADVREEVSSDKALRRSYARAGRPAPSVRLVDLRRQSQRGSGDRDGTPFHYSVRFVVGGATGGFWRDQVHGPKRSLRKRIWISPYLKGPEGAPLKVAGETPTVKVLR